ncbi:MAG TPA: serine/threonine-protein kinase [Longimicrobium sp.]|nr:serine/threonine-protein kinase [Longimicrobium sp.]
MSTLATLIQGRLLADRYRIGEALGFGGMGAVFRATDERLGRGVAVKVLTAASTDPAEQEILRRRFRREARIAAALRHSNVVTVHDFGTDARAGLDFLVMELLPGMDLCKRLEEARGPLSPVETLEIAREAAMGLAAGHRAGLVHRDVKPRNLFLVADPVGGWEVKVLDFGIAQLAVGDTTATRLTLHGFAPHTPRYAAPEQQAPDRVLTAATDVYALGLTALESLLGRYPEGLNTAADDAAAARYVDEVRRIVPGPLPEILLRALRRDAALRFPDADAFLRALPSGVSTAPAAASPPIVAHPPSSSAPSDALPHPIASAVSAAPAVSPPAARVGWRAVASSPPPAPAPAPTPAPEPAPPPKPKRKRKPMSPGVLWGGGGFVAALVVMLALRGGSAPAPEPVAAPVASPPARLASPALEIARQEAQRAVLLRGGIGFGETLWLVVLATHPMEEVESATSLRDRVRADHAAGLANGRVYPELARDSVAVVAGPFTRAEAEAALPTLRRQAPKARIREVTFQTPR